jgi:alkylhydroperoxidase family enzyme
MLISRPDTQGIAMKTPMSRFQIHDELTAPEGSVPVLRGALATGGQLPNFLGVLAGSPAALRGYARFRSELRHGALGRQTLERIAIAVAEHYRSEPGIALHARTARQAGLGLDEVTLARGFDSRDEREAALLRYLKALVEGQARPPMHLHEEAREAGWTDEQILEAVAVVALETFTAMVNVAGDVPVDGSMEDARTLKAA